MSRIRTIKPETLDDEPAAQLSDAAWRLWVSMWTLADDFGNLRAGLNFLAARVWQDASRDVARPLQELIAAGFLKPYAKDGQRYVHINRWEKHQRIDNAGKPLVPKPEEDDGTWSVQPAGLFAYSRRCLGESPRASASLGESPLAHSGGGTTTSISDLDIDHEGDRAREENKAEPEPPTSGPLQDGLVAVERTFWIESYKTGIAAGGGPAAYVFPDVKFKALRAVVEAHCTGEDRKNIPSWVQARVARFVRSRKRTGWPPNTVDPYHPDALLAWHNSEDFAQDARAQSGPRIKVAKPAPLETPPLSAEENEANARRLQDMLRGVGG